MGKNDTQIVINKNTLIVALIVLVLLLVALTEALVLQQVKQLWNTLANLKTLLYIMKKTFLTRSS